jgi:hypothetical protein
MSNAPTTLDAAFEVASDELLEIFLKKHRDYGKGNILSIKELGISMRVAEKAERLKHLLMKQELGELPENESIEDTWQDIAVYSIIAMLYRRKQFQELDVQQ